MRGTSEGGAARALRCMEIWGGSGVFEEALAMPGLDAWVYSLPCEGAEAGGDVHYVSLCGGGMLTRWVVADVSGHGAAVSEFSATLRGLVRRNINCKSQTRLVQALNRQFAALAQLRRFATAVVGTYLATRRTLAICNAGHPRPLWYRAATGDWVVLESAVAAAERPANLPLGVDEATPYDLFQVRLGTGDLVVAYTDALVEADDGSGALLGEDGLLAIARGLDPKAPARFGPALLEAVARHRGGAPADDDATLLVLHHNAGGPRHLGVAEKLDVYAKVFGLRAV